MDLDQQLRRLATRQWGHVSDRQALELGLGPQQIRHRTARGEWVRVTRRVLRSAAAADHPLARAQAMLLDVGGTAALARTSAAAVWHLPGFEPDPLHVVRDRDPHVRRSELGVVHTTRTFDERHVTTVDGLRVVVPMRCVVDLAGDIHPARVERLIDNVVGRGLGSYRSLHRIIGELAGRGRAGSTLLRELASARPPDARAPESNLEARVNQLLLRAGHRPLESQVDLGADDWIGRIDLVDRDLHVVVEVQSQRFHSSVLDRRHDAERRECLQAAGWVVVEVWDHDVWYRPDAVVGAIVAARLRAPRRAA
ncbi:MAG TPA: DUF559 domain-containing protein [Acidimicrobiales bacterium]|nr:DUF559 domain-containing protein [Acidimicrobiales bacterium]